MNRSNPVSRYLCLFSTMFLMCTWVAAESTTEGFKIVYHMDDTRNGRFALHLAQDHLDMNPDNKIAIVAYKGGVDFLLKGESDRDGNAYAPDVAVLMAKGVQFKVCETTLGFRDIPKSRVLSGISFVPSGTYEIIRLQAAEGYVYLKP